MVAFCSKNWLARKKLGRCQPSLLVDAFIDIDVVKRSSSAVVAVGMVEVLRL